MSTEVHLAPILKGIMFEWEFRWYRVNPDTQIKESADTAGLSAKIQLKPPGGGSTLATWTSPSQISLEGNRIKVRVPGTTTAGYAFDVAEWDLVLWETAHPEVSYRPAYGQVLCGNTVTSIT